MRRLHPVAYAAAFATLALHLAFNHRYGYYRDELYFIDCARHLSWGYVDQPPLAPLFAWLTTPVHYAVWAIRVPPAICAVLTVLLACAIARELRGGAYAQLIAALGAALSLGLLAFGYALSAEVLSPVTWTGIVYCILRLLRTNDPRWYGAMAAIFIVGFYTKYSILAFACTLAVGLLLTRNGAVLRSRWLAVSALVAVLAILPDAVWQVAHHFPMLEVLCGDRGNRHALANGFADESSHRLRNGAYFLIAQLLLQNLFLAPIWIAGVVAAARGKLGNDARFVAVAYGLLCLLAIVTVARPYYIEGVYPALFAMGSVAIERWAAHRSARQWNFAVFAFVFALVFAPLTFPLLPLSAYLRYESVLGLHRAFGSDARSHLVNPIFADQLGWKAMVHAVAIAYRSIPQPKRSQTAIFADRYAYASAIDFYGPRFGLPSVISPNNQYYLWGTHGYSGDSVLAVGATDYPLLLRWFGSVRQIAVYRNDYRWILEGPLPIYLCTHPKAPLASMWPRFKYYGL